MEDRELYKRSSDEMLDLYMTEILSKAGGEGNLNESMANFIDSEEYKNLDGVKAKRVELKRKAKIKIDEAREIARGRIEAEAMKNGANYSRLSVTEWSRTTQLYKDRVNEYYTKRYKGKSIDADRDKYIMYNGEPMNILNFGLQLAKIYGSKAGEL